MKHSLRTQRRQYDERPMSKKKVRAIRFVGDITSRAICEGEVHVISDEDDDGFVEVLPSNGELVAFVAADSTISVPSMFIGKVHCYSEDHKTVFLAQFQEVEPCKFKLNASKSYRESGNRLSIRWTSYIYLYASGVYELQMQTSTNRLNPDSHHLMHCFIYYKHRHDFGSDGQNCHTREFNDHLLQPF